MMRIRKGDQVIVLRGKDRGRTGRVLEVDPRTMRAKVEGLNQQKKHRRRTAKQLKPEIATIPGPIPLSALALVSKKDSKPVRVHFEERESGGKIRKVRVAKRTGEVFE